ncbi:MAG: hypothetical protein GX308_10080 [Epulopiscium sp.]|nr:hypothetical protein [Candidatus Epulonipiscium sp.]
MGIKFNREYEDISNELGEAIYKIEGFYNFFDMGFIEFEALTKEEKVECAKTLADDIFYGLFAENKIKIGSGSVEYNKQEHIIIIKYEGGSNQIINLI